MSTSWKSFDFFDVTQVPLADDETRLFFEGNEISCVCCGSDSLFVGTFDGFVRIIGPSWNVLKSFRAYDVGSITHMRQVEGTSLLLTIAQDLSSEPVLKTWALDKMERKTRLPQCLSTVQIHNARKQFPVSAFAALDDLSQLAVGFANGNVTLIRGDLINDLGAKQRIVHEDQEPITGVELRAEGRLTNLFISTTARIVRLSITSKGHAQPPRTIESTGCGAGCMTVDQRKGDIIVARDDAIYFYTLEGRGPPRAFDAPKSQANVFRDYVAIVSPPDTSGGGGGGSGGTAAPSDSNTGRRRFGGATADTLFKTSTFTLLETELRLIAHSEALVSTVKAVFELRGDLYVLLQNGKVYRYHEKTLHQRLDLFYQRNLFPLAIELAQKAGMDAKEQQVILRKFGDSLYNKGDHDGAMAQYIRAIDITEPSQVIRKFLDTQRIHNLIEYLEQIHEHHKATADHTTLLLNCYAKLKDIDKLEKFIKSPGDLKFDLDTAISMCRQGGYFEQAAYLAKKHGEEDLVVDILIEDCKHYNEALYYIWQLDPQAAYRCLMKYARVLIENCPRDATKLFIEYYTGRYTPKSLVVSVADAGNAPTTAAKVSSGMAASAVQNLANLLPLPYMGTPAGTSTPLSETNVTTASDQTIAQSSVTPTSVSRYSPPPPRSAFSSFIDHPDEFITFLEACLADVGAQTHEQDKSDLTTTLFEMYLQKAAEHKKPSDPMREKWEAKAKALISSSSSSSVPARRDITKKNTEEGKIPIENSSVLLLSHLSSFADGTTLVKEQAGLLADIFRSYAAAGDTRGALACLRRYGHLDPSLYILALTYLTSSPTVLAEARAIDPSVHGNFSMATAADASNTKSTTTTTNDGDNDAAGASSSQSSSSDALTLILQKIGTLNLLAPLQVVQLLSSGGAATMGLAKPYLSAAIRRERSEILANRERIADFRTETASRRDELRALAERPAVFQAARCSECGAALDLPVVHFLCRHSFHARCLSRGAGAVAAAAAAAAASGGGGSGGGSGGGNGGEAKMKLSEEEECPLCKGQNAAVRAMKRQQVESRSRHDLFQADVARADDRFGRTVAWFGRGVMGS